MKNRLVVLTSKGLYCSEGDFYIDPRAPVERALITHAHSDHIYPGSAKYITTTENIPFLKARLGSEINIQGQAYGEKSSINGVNFSFHPAGHILGSAQIRLEFKGEVWVITGDYKLQADITCAPFESLQCHTLISEATFGLPIYHWQPNNIIFSQIHAWCLQNKKQGKISVLSAYALGKAQRILANVDSSIGPIYVDDAIAKYTSLYRQAGITLPEINLLSANDNKQQWSEGLVLISKTESEWLRKIVDYEIAFASGWMQVRGNKRRKNIAKGFVLSDHADWPALLLAIKNSGAEKIFITHGAAQPLVHYLRETNMDAEELIQNQS